MCYVIDPHDMILKCSPGLCNRICQIFLLNILLCYVIDTPNLSIKPSPVLCVRYIEYACQAFACVYAGFFKYAY
jgi:hypothetical protein